jgi:Superfamily I DNA and RNA helicases
MAVLCRTHRLFEALQLAFGAMEVPAEFVNLAGLIHLPEIVEVLAYARATEDPRDGVALARILTGPRYRVGLRDLGVLAAWSRTSGGELRKLLADLALDEDDDLLEDHPFLMAEALERLDEIEGLTDEGRVRLAEFRDELDAPSAWRRDDRSASSSPRSSAGRGCWPSWIRPRTSRWRSRGDGNLAAFLEQVHAFQPVDGELTLRAFLEHLDSIDDDREWNPVQPSDDDSVKVMTVHAAKGLEFEAVFVPGLAHGLFPDARVQQNPARKGSSLDVELRRDATCCRASTTT